MMRFFTLIISVQFDGMLHQTQRMQNHFSTELITPNLLYLLNAILDVVAAMGLSVFSFHLKC